MLWGNLLQSQDSGTYMVSLICISMSRKKKKILTLFPLQCSGPRSVGGNTSFSWFQMLQMILLLWVCRVKMFCFVVLFLQQEQWALQSSYLFHLKGHVAIFLIFCNQILAAWSDWDGEVERCSTAIHFLNLKENWTKFAAKFSTILGIQTVLGL